MIIVSMHLIYYIYIYRLHKKIMCILCFDLYCCRHEDRSQQNPGKQSEIRKCPAGQWREIDVSVAFQDFSGFLK